MKLCLFFLFQILVSSLITQLRCADEPEKIHLTDSWAVHIESENDEVANDIAEKHGFLNIGQVINFFGRNIVAKY